MYAYCIYILSEWVFACVNAVSYTHLDVYKRQLWNCTFIQWIPSNNCMVVRRGLKYTIKGEWANKHNLWRNTMEKTCNVRTICCIITVHSALCLFNYSKVVLPTCKGKLKVKGIWAETDLWMDESTLKFFHKNFHPIQFLLYFNKKTHIREFY